MLLKQSDTDVSLKGFGGQEQVCYPNPDLDIYHHMFYSFQHVTSCMHPETFLIWNDWEVNVLSRNMTRLYCFLVLYTYKPLTLLLLGVVILLVNMHSFIYGVRQQLKGVHHLDVSPLLLPDQGSNHWAGENTQWTTSAIITRFITLSYRSRLVSSYIPCIGRPSCERMRIQWSDMLRITRGCKATETLPVTPEAITLGLATVTQRTTGALTLQQLQ